MWEVKQWGLHQAEEYHRWIEENSGRYQIEELFVNNGYGVTFMPLVII